jgi:hypothetical protein
LVTLSGAAISSEALISSEIILGPEAQLLIKKPIDNKTGEMYFFEISIDQPPTMFKSRLRN